MGTCHPAALKIQMVIVQVRTKQTQSTKMIKTKAKCLPRQVSLKNVKPYCIPTQNWNPSDNGKKQSAFAPEQARTSKIILTHTTPATRLSRTPSITMGASCFIQTVLRHHHQIHNALQRNQIKITEASNSPSPSRSASHKWRICTIQSTKH